MSPRPPSTRSAPRSLARSTAIALTATLLTACTTTGSGDRSSTTSRSGAPLATPTSAVPGKAGTAIENAPAALASLVQRLYAGDNLGAAVNASTARTLKARTSAGSRTSVPAGAKAATGTWFGTPVAVITAGDDVTLAVGPTWRVVGGWWPSIGVATPSLGDGPRWVLALGSDARKGQDITRTRADVLQVIGMDGRGGAGIMGLARDLWVPLSTGGKGKINSAMVFGGPDAQLRTVRQVTGLPIEGYALIGFDGFTTLVDDQGGIPIVIPETVNAPDAHIVIKAGPRLLTGRQALVYARERKTLPDGDLGRSRHQGQLILAAAVKAKLAGPLAIPRALTGFAKVGRSSLDAEHMLTFAAGLYRINPTKVGRGVAGGSFGWAGSQSIVVLGDQARRLFADFKDGNLS